MNGLNLRVFYSANQSGIQVSLVENKGQVCQCVCCALIFSRLLFSRWYLNLNYLSAYSPFLVILVGTSSVKSSPVPQEYRLASLLSAQLIPN